MAKNINFMSGKELRALAAEKGIEVPENATNREIRKLLGGSELKAETPAEILSYDEKLAKEPRMWVRVLNRDYEEGIDFGFVLERHNWHLVNGAVTRLPVSVINHLKDIRYPKVTYKQGEAGTAVKSEGFYYRFAITEVDAPEPAAAPV